MFLLKADPDINAEARGYGERTPLQAAVDLDDKVLVHLLLDRGGDINAKTAFKGGRIAL